MSLNKNNSEYGSNLLILKVVTQDEDRKPIDPIIVALAKDEESGKWVKKDTATSVSGDIKSVEVVTSDYEGEIRHSVKILIVDPESKESYLLDLRSNMLNRGILNQLLGLKSGEDITIGVYKNKKGYNASYLKQDGKSVSWKFDFKDVPAPTEIIHPKLTDENGKPKVLSRDYSEVDAFFLERTKVWANEVGLTREKAKAEHNSDTESKGPAVKTDDDDWE